MSRHRFIGLMTLVAISSFSFSASAETLLIDDFNDGNDDGWIQSDIPPFPLPWGPGIADASNGAYRLQSTGVVPADQFFAVASYWQDSADPTFSNGFVRATVTAENGGTTPGVLMRFDPSGGFGYVFGLEAPDADGPTAGDFFIVAPNATQAPRIETFFVPEFPAPSIGEDWIIEAGAVGDQITMKVWPASEVEPEQPQLTWTDSTHSTGHLGVSVGRDPLSLFEPWQLDGTFDDISFTHGFPPGIIGNPGLGGRIPPGLADGLPSQSAHVVPEPAAGVTALLGMGILALVSRKQNPRATTCK